MNKQEINLFILFKNCQMLYINTILINNIIIQVFN